MIKIAIEDNPKFEYSNLDIVRKGTSYTIDSIIDIKNKLNLKKQEVYYLI